MYHYHLNDSFDAGQVRFDQVLHEHLDPEPVYRPPRKWPHQVPPEHRHTIVRQERGTRKSQEKRWNS